MWKWLWENFEVHTRHMDIKGDSGEVADKCTLSEEYVYWRKGDPYCKVTVWLDCVLVFRGR